MQYGERGGCFQVGDSRLESRHAVRQLAYADIARAAQNAAHQAGVVAVVDVPLTFCQGLADGADAFLGCQQCVELLRLQAVYATHPVRTACFGVVGPVVPRRARRRAMLGVCSLVPYIRSARQACICHASGDSSRALFSSCSVAATPTPTPRERKLAGREFFSRKRLAASGAVEELRSHG